MRDPQWREGREQKIFHDIMQLSYIKSVSPAAAAELDAVSAQLKRGGNMHLPRVGRTVYNLSQL